MGKAVSPVRKAIFPPGKTIFPSGKTVFPVGKAISPSGKIVSPLGKTVSPLGKTISPPGKTVAPLGKAAPRRVNPSGDSCPERGELQPTGPPRPRAVPRGSPTAWRPPVPAGRRPRFITRHHRKIIAGQANGKTHLSRTPGAVEPADQMLALATRVRASLKGKYGAQNEKLEAFGIKANRRRAAAKPAA